MPQSNLFDIATEEPRVDLFMCYLSGRLTGKPELADQITYYYNEWKSLGY